MREILQSYPDGARPEDIAAFEYLFQESEAKERVGVEPEFTFNQFEKGIASHIPGLLPLVDAVGKIESPPSSGQFFIPNYDSPCAVDTIKGYEFLAPGMLDSFARVRDRLETERNKSAILMLAPHPSMATPYLIARSLLDLYGPNFANNIHIVIGPRPASFSYQISEQAVSPVGLGRALSTLHLTGPNTESTRSAPPEIQEWVKAKAADFKRNIEEIVEPVQSGDNAIIIISASGRIAERTRAGKVQEYRSDSLAFLASLGRVGIMPVGVYDNLLVNKENSGSVVFMNPDSTVWRNNNDRNIQHLHQRAVMLSESPFGALDMETVAEQNRRLVKKRVRDAGKRMVTALSPAKTDFR